MDESKRDFGYRVDSEKMRYYSTHLLESRPPWSVWNSKMQLAEWARAQGFTPVAYETQGNYVRLFVR